MLRTECLVYFKMVPFHLTGGNFSGWTRRYTHKNVHLPHDGKVSLEFLTLSLTHTEKPDFLNEGSDVLCGTVSHGAVGFCSGKW